MIIINVSWAPNANDFWRILKNLSEPKLLNGGVVDSAHFNRKTKKYFNKKICTLHFSFLFIYLFFAADTHDFLLQFVQWRYFTSFIVLWRIPSVTFTVKTSKLKMNFKHFFLNVASKLFKFIIPTCLCDHVIFGFIFACVLWITLKPILVFFFVFVSFLIPIPPPLAHLHAASQSEAQKKLQPITQVPVLQEQGEYSAGVGDWTWVWAWRGLWLCLSCFILSLSLTLETASDWLLTFLWGPLWPLSCSEGDLSTSHRCEAALTLKRCARTSISVKAV